MKSTVGRIVLIVLALVVGYAVFSWVLHLALSLVWTLMPVLIVGGIGYVLYQVYGRKALGGGRRTLL